MKLVTTLIRLSLVATASAALGFATGRYELAAFGAATSSLLLLIAARDYAPRSRRWQPRLAPANRPTASAHSSHHFRLAA